MLKNKIIRYSFFLIISFITNQLYSQDIPITLKAVNKKNEPIPFATFTVTKRTDSLQTQNKTADSTGKAVFNLLNETQYIVHITSVNYQSVEKGINISGNQRMFVFTAEPISKTLSGVTVTSSKPLMRQEDDKTIVDPENLAASSTNAFEIMEKIPGLFVDQDGNIYLSSTTPATIYINNREMRMSNADIATMLKNLPPNSISKIEILRTPSAKYDASGSGGVVNIILKKGVKLGLTGSVSTGLNQGIYGNKFIGLTLNNNADKRNSYLNLNYSRRNSFEEIKTDRTFAPDSLLSQTAYTKYPGDSYYTGYGIGFTFNKKWELNYDGRISLNNSHNTTNNRSTINKISTAGIITDNLAGIKNNNLSFTANQGINTKYKIDSLGSEWTTDMSYTYSNINSEQLFTTNFYTPIPALIGGDGDIKNTRHNFAAQTDLKWKLKKKFTVETGLKSSVLQFNSSTNYFKEAGSTRIKDNFRTNTFRYKENINAAYVQVSKTLVTDMVLKAGVRMENTNMKGRQIIPGDTSFNIHRTDFFPYVYLSKNIMKIAGYDLRAYLVYRKTIARPAYESLNPFPRYIDQYVTETGNPSLRPQFTQNYEANISVDETPLLAIGHNYTKDIFTNVVYQTDSLALRTYDNLGTNQEFYFRALGALPPGKKYFFVAGAQYNHNFYEGLYENKPLSFKRGSWTFFTYHTLKLGKLSQLSVNGFIRLKGQLQFYELSNFGQLSTNINRQFLKKKLIVTLSMNDIFYTNKNDFFIQQGSVLATGYRRGDTRRFGINFRYNFGVRKRDEGNNILNVESPENQGK
jgi:iron complex outermembrane recepter protein